jgi:hypothetical protein
MPRRAKISILIALAGMFAGSAPAAPILSPASAKPTGQPAVLRAASRVVLRPAQRKESVRVYPVISLAGAKPPVRSLP